MRERLERLRLVGPDTVTYSASSRLSVLKQALTLLDDKEEDVDSRVA